MSDRRKRMPGAPPWANQEIDRLHDRFDLLVREVERVGCIVALAAAAVSVVVIVAAFVATTLIVNAVE